MCARRQPARQRLQRGRGAPRGVRFERPAAREHQHDQRPGQVFAEQDRGDDGHAGEQVGAELEAQGATDNSMTSGTPPKTRAVKERHFEPGHAEHVSPRATARIAGPDGGRWQGRRRPQSGRPASAAEPAGGWVGRRPGDWGRSESIWLLVPSRSARCCWPGVANVAEATRTLGPSRKGIADISINPCMQACLVAETPSREESRGWSKFFGRCSRERRLDPAGRSRTFSLPFQPVFPEQLDRVQRPNRPVAACQLLGWAVLVAAPAGSGRVRWMEGDLRHDDPSAPKMPVHSACAYDLRHRREGGRAIVCSCIRAPADPEVHASFCASQEKQAMTRSSELVAA